MRTRIVVGTPLGPVTVLSTAAGVAALGWDVPADELPEGDPHGAAEALRRWFGGALDALDTLPLDLRGTPFQQRVWAALRRIPAGATRTYGEIAAELGDPGAVRAVGAANGRNPVAIAVPCHRVIGADGSLTGYAAGLARKRALLAHEGVVVPGERQGALFG